MQDSVQETFDSRQFILRALLGAVAFGAVQGMLWLRPPDTPVPGDPSWFLNSITGVAAAGIAMLAAGLLSAFLRPIGVPAASVPVVIGAAAVMVVVFVFTGGGNLFPLVLFFGAAFIAVAATTGAWIASEARTRFSARRGP